MQSTAEILSRSQITLQIKFSNAVTQPLRKLLSFQLLLFKKSKTVYVWSGSYML